MLQDARQVHDSAFNLFKVQDNFVHDTGLLEVISCAQQT